MRSEADKKQIDFTNFCLEPDSWNRKKNEQSRKEKEMEK